MSPDCAWETDVGDVIVAQGAHGLRLELDGQTIRMVYGGRVKHPDESWAVTEVEEARVFQAIWQTNFRLRASGNSRLLQVPKENRAAFDEIERQIAARWQTSEAIAAAMPGKLAAIRVAPETNPSTPGVVTRAGLRLGELSRHFDSKTLGTITGFMNHSLGFEGWGVGVSVGRFTLGTGRLGLSGASTVELSASSIARTDMLNDGFIAVFEAEVGNDIDTLRLVVPSEAACRSAMADAIQILDAGIKPGRRWSPTSLQRLVAQSQALVSTETSYVSDRLNAALRADDAKSRRFAVVGVELAPHELLGGAIQFPGDSVWHQLFPVALMRMLGSEELAGLGPGQRSP